MKYRTWVEIDERALSSNISQLRALTSSGTRFCAVVKANAYGHGLREVVHIAARAGTDAFAVDSLDDALSIRGWMPSALIVVIGYTLHERLRDAVLADIHLTVYDVDTIRAIEDIAAKEARQAHVHIKLETGTARQGVLADDLNAVIDALQSAPHVHVAGVSTHFANIEDTSDTRFATLQLSRFREAVDAVRARGLNPEWVHCACSAAIILYPETHGTLVRAGISMYGIWPSPITEQTSRKHGVPCDLTPVLSWKSRIAQVKSLPTGSPVGYGLTEVLKRNSRLAVVPVGYWDGYDRGLSSIGETIVGGSRCRVVGRVFMNMIVIDVSTVPNIEREQEVLLLGRAGRHEVSANRIADQLETIPYEILARINPTLPRVIV